MGARRASRRRGIQSAPRAIAMEVRNAETSPATRGFCPRAAAGMAGSQAVLERLDHVELLLAGRGLEVAYPIDLPRLLGLGDGRGHEEHRTSASKERPTV